jgi:hypothetical protein
VTAKLYVKKEWKNVYNYIFHRRTKFTFFSAHGGKYLFLIELLTLNSNMQVVFLHHPRFFFCDSQVKCAVPERHTLRFSRMPSAMNRRLSHSLPASEHIQLVIW